MLPVIDEIEVGEDYTFAVLQSADDYGFTPVVRLEWEGEDLKMQIYTIASGSDEYVITSDEYGVVSQSTLTYDSGTGGDFVTWLEDNGYTRPSSVGFYRVIDIQNVVPEVLIKRK